MGWNNGLNATETGVQTINNGNWTGSVLTQHAVLVGDASSAITSVGPSSTSGQLLQCKGATSDPAYTTATYPSTTTVSQLLYSSSANVVAGLATANNSILITSATGVPSLLTGGGNTGYVPTIQSNGTVAWAALPSSGITGTTTQYAVIVGAGTNSVGSVGPSATAGQIFQSGGSSANPAYSTATYPTVATSSGTFLIANGTNWVASTSTIPTSAGNTANKLLLSDGTNYALSTPTFPNASATSRKIIVSDGTNWTASTETYAVPGSSGNVMTSNGTNWTSATPAVALIGKTDSASPYNTALGYHTNPSDNGINNVAIGWSALAANSTGNYNVAIGYGALTTATGSGENVAIGDDALQNLTSAVANTAIGVNSGYHLTTGHHNTLIGHSSGTSYTSSESSNIILGTDISGTGGESHVIRIGTTGSGDGQQSTCYIAGIEGVTVSNAQYVTINTSTNQLGSTAIPTALTGVTNSGSPYLTALGSGAATSTTGVNNTAIGYHALNTNVSGTSNTAIGYEALAAFTTGAQNIAIGDGAWFNSTTGNYTTVIGQQAAAKSTFNPTYSTIVGWGAVNNGALSGTGCVAIGAAAGTTSSSGDHCTYVGYAAGYTVTSGTLNTFVGADSGNVTSGATGVTTGSSNTFIGYLTGSNYTSSETSNILIGAGVLGTLGESNVLRIGDAGSYAVTKAFIGGIYGVSPSSPQMVIINSSGQLGSQAIAGTAISTINGDSGSITGATVTIKAGFSTQNAGGTVEFVNSGTTATLNVTDSNANTLIGNTAGNASYSGTNNTAVGSLSLHALSSGIRNTTVGWESGEDVNTGSYNTFVGCQAGANVTSGQQNVAIGDACFGTSGTNGSYNVIIGQNTASSFTGTESSNIIIQNSGVSSESNAIRIGTSGTGNSQQSTCYIAGIDGVTVTGTAVLISTSGQLGDISSSIKMKENIQQIQNQSFMDLTPVQFTYKSDPDKNICYGMIAEEVVKIFPELVLYKNGDPYSLKYHEMPALLLAEIQKLNKRITALEGKK